MSNENKSGKAKVILPVIAFIVAVLSLAASLIVYNTKDFGVRRDFYFYSIDKKSIAREMRYLSKEPLQGDVQLFVDELVLGPMTYRFQRIFAKGTSVEFCTLQDDVLYVGLSQDALKSASGNTVATKEELLKSIDLFKVNIVRNFTKINTIMVYIDGKSISDDA